MIWYGDNDPGACAWLRELVQAGEIPDGRIDTRDIREVQAGDLIGLRQAHFFAGIGGWAYALHLARFPADRQVWTGSCPCPPFSSAGRKKCKQCGAAGLRFFAGPKSSIEEFGCPACGWRDARHLWPEFWRLIRECRPAAVFGEQVASPLAVEWLTGVRADLEGAGYAVGAADLPAACVGAPHIRQRLWWVAYAGRVGGWPAEAESGKASRAVPRAEVRRPDSRMANRLHGGREDRRGENNGEDEGCHSDGQAIPAVAPEAAEHRADKRLADRGKHGREQGAEVPRQRTWQPVPADGGEAGGLELADGTGLQPGRATPKADGYGGAAEPTGSLGRWDGVFIPCGDGKARRIEPGIEPLVHGIPGRVWLLRGYGNAIVPEVAAEFIRAAEEARDMTARGLPLAEHRGGQTAMFGDNP